MSRIDDILETIKAGIIQVSKEKAIDFIKQAESDGNAFLESIKDDLKEWSKQLMDGDLSKEDFEFLVRGKRDLATMNALTQAGYAGSRQVMFAISSKETIDITSLCCLF